MVIHETPWDGKYKYSTGLMRIKNATAANKVKKKWFPLKVK